MSWHDVHMRLSGPPVQDLVRHVVQRWNFTRAAKGKTGALPALLPHGPWPGYIPRSVGAAGHGAGAMRDEATQTTVYDITGGAAGDPSQPIGGSGAAGTGASPGDNAGRLPPGGVHEAVRQWLTRAKEHRAAGGAGPTRPTKPPKFPTASTEWYCGRDWTQSDCNSHVQILRSVGEWSVGTSTENSVYHAYIHAILSSEHSLYIENQYIIR